MPTLCRRSNQDYVEFQEISGRRVVGKAEHLGIGANQRFIVSSLHSAQVDAQRLYEQVYCAQGEAENRIKEQQLYLFADRTSCSAMKANQLRLWFSSVAYCLLCEHRRVRKGTHGRTPSGRRPVTSTANGAHHSETQRSRNTTKLQTPTPGRPMSRWGHICQNAGTKNLIESKIKINS